MTGQITQREFEAGELPLPIPNCFLTISDILLQASANSNTHSMSLT